MTVLDIAELYARLSKKESSKILASEELHNRNLQWLEDIQAEAKSLFKKERKKDTEDVLLEGAETTNSNKEETELDDSGCSQIILLPKTPRVIRDLFFKFFIAYRVEIRCLFICFRNIIILINKYLF